MQNEEKINVNMAEMKSIVDEMEPVLKQCSIVMINLMACVNELLNRHDASAITEMETVCQEIFSQARLAIDSMEQVKQ